MNNICIVGFGNIAHALIANNQNTKYKITVYTDSDFLQEKEIYLQNQVDLCSGLYQITHDIELAVSCADVVILALPTHVRRQVLGKIKLFLKPNTLLGAMPGTSGFNDEVDEVLGGDFSLFSLQRVPFISRVLKKGVLVNSYKKPAIDVAIRGNQIDILEFLRDFLKMEVNYLSSFDSVNLSNSNPLLHTARIYSFLINKTKPYEINQNEKFYEDWTLDASEVLLKMDQEFIKLIKQLNITSVNDLLTHYGVSNANELTLKIRNIEAFKGIDFPKTYFSNESCYVDLQSRYFKEDFEYGLFYLKNKAKKANVATPTINLVTDFYCKNVLEA